MRMEKQEFIENLLHQMTIEEKASLCSGADFWHTKSLDKYEIPEIMMSDGPHGLRKQAGEADHLGINESIKTACYPAACATASSFDEKLAREMGELLGEECNAEGVDILLGPAVNMKRSPLCGRNFEYYSEDPYLTGVLATEYIKGVQSKGIGTSMKHFAANNQEYRRMSTSSNVSERALRELYLPAFERAVKEAQPKTIMCSYNKVNGTFMSENEELLTKVLREEWGFEGCVITDWGAVNDRVKGILAGLDIEMPGSNGINDADIVEAVKTGALKEEAVDTVVRRILSLILSCERKEAVVDRDQNHKKAIEFAQESAILLENNGVLPLKSNQKICYVGEFAKSPRYQGGGSSHINSWNVTSAYDTARNKNRDVEYVMGFPADKDDYDEKAASDVLRAVKGKETVVVFAGLPDEFESEGYDRTHMRLPECQNRLIEEICDVCENVVVVLHNGSPVECPWAQRVSAILEMYLGGEGVGEATDALLYGEVSPSGHLAETFPLRLEDTPSYLTFANDKHNVIYAEDIFIGYRYYDKRNMKVRWPFGHGLSYTTFQYENLSVDKSELCDSDVVTVSVDVTNTGSMTAKEVVQVYVEDMTQKAVRPIRELKGFCKVELQPNETRRVSIELEPRSFSWYCEEAESWIANTGEYAIAVGASSRDIRCRTNIRMNSTQKIPFHVDLDTCVGDLFENPKTGAMFKQMMNRGKSQEEEQENRGTMVNSMMLAMPLRCFKSFVHMPKENLNGLIAMLNKSLEEKE